jgi:TonB family protein
VKEGDAGVLRAISFSLAGHAALVLALLLLAATRPPLRIAEVVRPVRLVASIEAPAARPAPRPARVAEPPQARVPAPEPAARPAAPEPPAPGKAEPARPVAVPKIVIPTAGAQPAPAPPRPAPEAKARPNLRERLEQRLAAVVPAESRPAEAPQPKLAALPPAEAPAAPRLPAPAGAPPSQALPPGPVVALGTFPYAWYLAMLKEKVYAQWSPPSEFYLGRRAATALVALRIDRAGNLSHVSLRESSGYARFDQSALGAVQALRSAPGLPQQYPEDALDVIIRFQNE